MSKSPICLYCTCFWVLLWRKLENDNGYNAPFTLRMADDFGGIQVAMLTPPPDVIKKGLWYGDRSWTDHLHGRVRR